jgi:predicted nucleic-acid-binding Zn-ribbon protein
MKSGQCPKCQARQVYSGAALRFKSGSHDHNAIPITLFRSVALDNYVCCNCGYVESYVSDKGKLELIAQKWPKA